MAYHQNEGQGKQSIVVQELSAANALLSTALLHEQQVAGLQHAARQRTHIPATHTPLPTFTQSEPGIIDLHSFSYPYRCLRCLGGKPLKEKLLLYK